MLLAISIAVNVWGMVHYRLPGPLWRALEHRGEMLPKISLATHGLTLPMAQLGFSGATKPRGDIGAWQSNGRAKLRELLGVTPPAGAPPVRAIERIVQSNIIRETLVFTMPDGVEIP